MKPSVWPTLAFALVAGCGAGEIETGSSSTRTEEGLSGCQGHASSSIPSSEKYFLTSFGGGSDTQSMSCGGTADGTWYYAASKQRFGCGAHIQIEANGKCVVAATDDYGPDVCVEAAAGGPIIDASPKVSKYLFGTSSAGWSDRLPVTAKLVASTVALGPCTSTGGGGGAGGSGGGGGGGGGGAGGSGGSGGGGGGGGSGGSGGTDPAPDPGPATCSSGTLDRSVPTGTCVQSASDGAWYHCDNGNWDSGQTGCTISYGYCHSSTLGRDVPARTCVQSVHDRVWYQCDSDGWNTPVANGAGPVGPCSAEYSL